MTPALENLLRLADRDIAAGRFAFAEAEYAKVLEADPDSWYALHGRGVAHTWQSSLLVGDPVALIDSTEDALKLCRAHGGDEAAFLDRISFELINLTSIKYNELTRVYTSLARKENRKAPSPLFFHTWSVSRPQGLALEDMYIPLINYLAAIVMISEYLDRLLEEREDMKVRRLHNICNLAIFYDWVLSFESTGTVDASYAETVRARRARIDPLRESLEAAVGAPEVKNLPDKFPEGKPLPGVAIEADRENKIAHFPLRPPFEVICPVCGTVQKSNRSICYQCSCKFFFDDDVD